MTQNPPCRSTSRGWMTRTKRGGGIKRETGRGWRRVATRCKSNINRAISADCTLIGFVLFFFFPFLLLSFALAAMKLVNRYRGCNWKIFLKRWHTRSPYNIHVLLSLFPSSFRQSRDLFLIEIPINFGLSQIAGIPESVDFRAIDVRKKCSGWFVRCWCLN